MLDWSAMRSSMSPISFWKKTKTPMAWSKSLPEAGLKFFLQERRTTSASRLKPERSSPHGNQNHQKKTRRKRARRKRLPEKVRAARNRSVKEHASGADAAGGEEGVTVFPIADLMIVANASGPLKLLPKAGLRAARKPDRSITVQ